jgi:hypothetical protein
MRNQKFLPGEFASIYISERETIARQIDMDNGILEMIQDTIRDTYRGFRSVSIGRTADAEVPGGEKICFEIDLAGKDAHVIEDERAFHKTLIQRVPREERQFLRFTYHVS